MEKSCSPVVNKISYSKKKNYIDFKESSIFYVHPSSKKEEKNIASNCYSGTDTENKLKKTSALLTGEDRVSNIPISLNASEIGDFPVQYSIYSLEEYQFPAVGLYIDPRIIPGFKYHIRRLPDKSLDVEYKESYLFNGKSLTLLRIGRGYARRFTFENDDSILNNENYFYSDNHLNGDALELQVVFEADKFTIYDANHEPQGILEVVKVNKRQVEVNTNHLNGEIHKTVNVSLTAKVEFYDAISQQFPITGIAICTKSKSKKFAQTVKIINVNIKHHKYYLLPGHQENCRRICIQDIDIPTKYTIIGILPYEMPVIGTYVDPRILPGFYYKVRLNSPKKHLFNGKSCILQHIGFGYAKKLVFESDSFLNPTNYFWSDSYRDGFAFEIKVVMEGMKFIIIAQSQILGTAEVFKANLPQLEERMERIQSISSRCDFVKYVYVDVICNMKVGISDNGSYFNQTFVRVCGLAVVRKEPNVRNAYVERIENIALDSQLNVLFAREYSEVTFLPIN